MIAHKVPYMYGGRSSGTLAQLPSRAGRPIHFLSTSSFKGSPAANCIISLHIVVRFISRCRIPASTAYLKAVDTACNVSPASCNPLATSDSHRTMAVATATWRALYLDRCSCGSDLVGKLQEDSL